MSEDPRKIAILGGTGDARRLAEILVRRGFDAVTALAGRTSHPDSIAGKVRTGHFGGAAALSDWLLSEKFDALIDATHPFAGQISLNAHEAGKLSGIPVVHLVRPEWREEPGDQWIRVKSHEEAASTIPENARVFLSVGRQPVAHFSHRQDIHAVMRMIEAPGDSTPLPPGEIILARPGRTVDAELTLFRTHRISCLVAKNSGGEAARCKIDAARFLSIPVIMIDRPAAPEGETVADIDEAVARVLGI